MITAIIIDDQQHSIDKLSYLLAQHCKSDIKLLPSFQSVEEGVAAIQQLQPDVVLLDVELKDDETGFDVLKRFDDIPFAVIFTTAYEKYAIQAIRFSAMDYLVKPIHADELKAAIDKLKRELSKRDISKNIKALLGNLHKDAASKHIVISSIESDTVLPVCDIIYCESAGGNCTNLYLQGEPGKPDNAEKEEAAKKDKSNKTKIFATKTLKVFEELLSDYNFFRVHNSHLINLSYVKKYDKVRSIVLMSDGSKIQVSTRRKEAFLEALRKM